MEVGILAPGSELTGEIHLWHFKDDILCFSCWEGMKHVQTGLSPPFSCPFLWKEIWIFLWSHTARCFPTHFSGHFWWLKSLKLSDQVMDDSGILPTFFCWVTIGVSGLQWNFTDAVNTSCSHLQRCPLGFWKLGLFSICQLLLSRTRCTYLSPPQSVKRCTRGDVSVQVFRYFSKMIFIKLGKLLVANSPRFYNHTGGLV